MNFTRDHSRLDRARDAGMSLVEVIVAIAIISVVALSSATLTINGIAMASTQERKQIAVTIASGVMETVSSLPVASLYSGRSSAAVQAAFTANAGVPGVPTAAGGAPTYPVWDKTVPLPSIVAVPITNTLPIIRSGTTFTTTTLLGACYQPQAGGDCTTVSGYSTPPAVTPSGSTPLIRVVVIVRWTAGSSCGAGGCFYSTTTIVDPNQDLEWVTHG